MTTTKTLSGPELILPLTAEKDAWAERLVATYQRLLDERLGVLRADLETEIRAAHLDALKAITSASVANARGVFLETTVKDLTARLEALEAAGTKRRPRGVSGVFRAIVAAGGKR
jgi:predicted RecB family endonuclease